MRILLGAVFGLVVAVTVRAQVRYSTLSLTPPFEDKSTPHADWEYSYSPTTDKRVAHPQTVPDYHPDERNCPPGISQFSEHDIKAAIDFAIQWSKVADQMESSFPKYKDLRDVYLADLNNFINSIENRPAQLEQILKMIEQTRNQLEPVVREFHHVANQVSVNKLKFQGLQQQINITLEKLDRYTRICELNGCSPKPLKAHIGFKTFDSVDSVEPNRYLCISMNDLQNYISDKLMNFVHDYNDTVIKELERYKSHYEVRIPEVKNVLKDRALIAFGRTMFDILLLQDELYNFNITVNMGVGSIAQNILNNVLEIQWKLNIFNDKVKSYGARCSRCKDEIFQYDTVKPRLHTSRNGMQLVEELLDGKLDVLKNDMMTKVRDILKILDDKIKVAEETKVLEKHVELQANIRDMIKSEQLALEELKKMAPADKINSMTILLHESQLALENIERHSENIQ